jgi:glycerophosphoryl diester phosphodiesterase
MAAFAAAVALGYTYLETDLQATRDGVLAVFHDDELQRLTGRAGRVLDVSWDELSRLRVDGREPIPRFEAVLAEWPHLRLNLDPKTDAAAALLPEALTRAGAVDRVCIGSFSQARLAQLRRALGPRLCTSMGPKEVTRLRFASWHLPVGGFDALCAQVPRRWYGARIVDRCFVRAAHRRGLPVHVWTVNEEAEMRRLLDLGVDGLITDRPGLLKAVLEERGEWHGAAPA